MFQDYYGDRSVDEVTRVFGPRFARALFDLPTGSWQGPIESGYGWHLVFIDSIRAAYLPGFDEIAPEVKTAWIEAERATVRERAFEEMRARYAVVLPQDFRPDDLALGALAQAPAVDGGPE
jgi:parvulin-like peptidyl-prolyl isomerase